MTDGMPVIAVFAATLMAAFPLAAIVWVRRSGPAARRSIGRTFVVFALLYGASLLGFRWPGVTVTMLVYGMLIGFLAAPRGTRAAYRVLYGADWVAANADAVRREGMRLVIPFTSVAIACVTIAIGLRVTSGVIGPLMGHAILAP